jgi:enterochelin esterase-like enzyme
VKICWTTWKRCSGNPGGADSTMPTVRPQTDWPAGKIVHLGHHSAVLENNPWNDPADREVAVYLPHGYSDSDSPYVTLWDLAAYTSSGPAHLNWRNHGESLRHRLDRLIGSGKMGPAVVVLPDCYTSLGGNQYVNSVAVGHYADYLVQELIPFIDESLNVVGHRSGRAVFGKSSGGYGALYHAMNYPESWGAAASHAGDMGFDLLFRGEFPTACSILSAFKGDTEAFLQAFWRKNRPNGRDFTVLMILAMAASYDPDPDAPARIRLPFDLHSCEVDDDRWRQWLAFDPLNMLDHCAEALRAMHGLYIDVGMYDQYHIQYGARRFTRRLAGLGIDHYYEEFEGTHSAIDWRLDLSLPYLTAALKTASGEAI